MIRLEKLSTKKATWFLYDLDDVGRATSNDCFRGDFWLLGRHQRSAAFIRLGPQTLKNLVETNYIEARIDAHMDQENSLKLFHLMLESRQRNC